jgi:hypothetical protein
MTTQLEQDVKLAESVGIQDEYGEDYKATILQIHAFANAIREQAVPDVKTTEEFIDFNYFDKKLKLIIRDLRSYSPQELSRELMRLANTAAPRE